MKIRINGLAVVAAAVLGAALLPGSGVALAGACEPGGPDFNGDNCADLAVADPEATVSGKQHAGRVTVVYGGDSASPAVLSQGQAGVNGTPETDDRFGTAVRAARINNDGFDDLVVSTPSESVGSADDAGIIHVVYGSAGGLGAGAAGLTVRQGLHGVPGTPEAGDRFGAALAVNTTTGDSGSAPAIAFGAPGENIGSVSDAGTAGVVAFDYATGEVSAAAAIDQDSAGISNTVEAGDRFGAAVEVFQGPGGFFCDVTGVDGFTLVVGAPAEDLSGVRDAGMVHVARDLNSDTPVSQNSPGVDGTSEAGDQFGSSLALTSYCEHDGPSHVTLAVGVPTENIGDVTDAGMMHLFRTDDDELPLPHLYSVHQGTAGVLGSVEAGDRFGTAVTLGGPWQGDGVGEPVLVNAPGEDVGTAADAGALYIFGDLEDAPGDSEIRITHPDIAEPAAAGDHFGTVVVSHADYLYIGVPDDARYPQGVVHGLVWDHLLGDGEGRQLLMPGSDGIPTGAARFGAGLA